MQAFGAILTLVTIIPLSVLTFIGYIKILGLVGAILLGGLGLPLGVLIYPFVAWATAGELPLLVFGLWAGSFLGAFLAVAGGRR